MNRAAAGLLLAVAIATGIAGAELMARSIQLRDELGDLCGRGRLLALVGGRGVYQADLDRALHESDFLNEIERSEWADVERRSMLTKAIVNSAARSHASGERIQRASTKREFDLLRAQFRDDETWGAALRGSNLSAFSLFHVLKNDLQARKWIAKQIVQAVNVSEDECRQYYNSHPENFFVPERFHAAHMFLAAPPETAPEIVDAKKKLIEALSVRLGTGEDFATLAAEASEDEASKLNGGDLGYFSIDRMPPDFFAAAVKLRPGESSRPVQTRLGFHVIRLIETQPARQRTFDESRNDIAVELANQKRTEAVKKLVLDLGSEADYLRPF